MCVEKAFIQCNNRLTGDLGGMEGVNIVTGSVWEDNNIQLFNAISINKQL